MLRPEVETEACLHLLRSENRQCSTGERLSLYKACKLGPRRMNDVFRACTDRGWWQDSARPRSEVGMRV